MMVSSTFSMYLPPFILSNPQKVTCDISLHLAYYPDVDLFGTCSSSFVYTAFTSAFTGLQDDLEDVSMNESEVCAFVEKQSMCLKLPVTSGDDE